MSRAALAATAATRSLRSGRIAVVVALVAALVVGYASSSTQSIGTFPHRDHGLTAADGVLPRHVTVFDDRYPGVTDLDPDLLRALRRAATAAGANGVELFVTSGWRSPAYQRRLLREAVAEYGSRASADRWVAPVQASAHVTGDAVDIGPATAMVWLSQHGAAYGLCRVYANEPWHFELRRQASVHRCPATYPDAAHDQRIR